MAQVVESLLSKHETLSSNPSSTPTPKKREKRKEKSGIGLYFSEMHFCNLHFSTAWIKIVMVSRTNTCKHLKIFTS
jgi:hypothetical protein